VKFITASSHVKKIDGRPEGNAGKRAGGRSLAFRGRCGEGGSMGLLYLPSVELLKLNVVMSFKGMKLFL
jgi:hypothetical protein